jgi:cytochrome bd-type quinol oxidase subunit 2
MRDIQVILVSIVPFDCQKRSRLFLSSYLIKLLQIFIRISIDHEFPVLLKSSFHRLSVTNSAENKEAFSPLSRIFMMVPHMVVFFLPFFLFEI